MESATVGSSVEVRSKARKVRIVGSGLDDPCIFGDGTSAVRFTRCRR